MPYREALKRINDKMTVTYKELVSVDKGRPSGDPGPLPQRTSRPRMQQEDRTVTEPQ